MSGSLDIEYATAARGVDHQVVTAGADDVERAFESLVSRHAGGIFMCLAAAVYPS